LVEDIRRASDFYRLQPLATLTWENKTGLNETPTTDTEIDVSQAESIAIQAKTDTGNTSTSLDINVHATLDGSVWDTVEYAPFNLGNGETKTVLVSPGVRRIRLRLDVNNGVGYVTAKVLVRT